MGFRLTIEQGKGRGQAFDFDGDEIVIGRSDDADVVLADGGVSRRHARIAIDGDRWVLEDLETANGTFLNGSKIDQELLENGDHIGIGQVVFRFDGDQPQDGSTRIVSLPKGGEANATNPAASQSAAAPAAAGPGGLKLNPKQIRLLAMGGGALVLVFVLMGLLRGGGGGGGGEECPNPLVPKDGIEQIVFSRVDGQCDPGDALVFSFDHPSKTRVIMHYAPFLTEKGELAIELNGKKIGEAPLAPTRRSSPQTLVLPDAQLDDGADNKLVFRYLKGDEMWGIERFQLELIGLNEADLQKAQDAYELGTRRYRERGVAAPNLYQAWMYLRDARRYMEGLDPKPDMYKATLDLIRDVEKELEKVCQQHLFAGAKHSQYGKIEKANEEYKFLLAAFPGNAHPCRAKAEEQMFVEDATE